MNYSTNKNLKWNLENLNEYCSQYREINMEQAHKVCVGQNELVMSLLEDFGLNLTLKWRSRSNTVHEFLTCVAMINHEKYDLYSQYIC
jgi:hypothetical protein